jgi:4-aminobutyrate aminotransferase
MERLRNLQDDYDFIGEIRGKGLFIGMELVEDRDSRKPAKALAGRVIERAFHNGLLLLTCGLSTVRFMPPLLVSREQVDEALTILEASLREAQG